MDEVFPAKSENRNPGTGGLGATVTSESRHRLFWVGLILALLGGQMVLLTVAVYLAESDASFAIEPDYYRKGLNWDATAAQLRENVRLGWTLGLELGEKVSVLCERTVTCTLADKAGRPLDGATVDLIAFPHARGNERASATLIPAGDGRYESKVRFARRGLWEFRFVVQREGQTFTEVQRRDVYPHGESRPWRP
jgi:nitrogen fixation protein FixH